MIKTKFKTYTPKEVIEEFSGELKNENMPALVEHLEDHQRAVKTEGYREIDGQLYFKLEGLWVKYGRPFRSPSEVLSMTDEELELSDQEELLQYHRYAKERLYALRNIKKQIRYIPVLKIHKLFEKKRKWYFDRYGFQVSQDWDMHSEPIKIIHPSTPLKKDILEELEREKKDWLNFSEKLSTGLDQIRLR